MENIPENILPFIEEQSFDALSEANKLMVLQHLTRADYDALHRTALLLRQIKTQYPSNPVQKDKLMAHFVKHYYTNTFRWSTPVQLWKAASIIIILGSAWFLHWQTYQYKQVQYVTQLDTVYLEKEVPFKVYDTVYYKDEASVTYTSSQKRHDIPGSSRMHKQNTKTIDKHIEPQRRGISAKDDSLIQSFKFVTL